MSNQWWPDTATSSEFISPSHVIAGRGSSARAAELLASRLDCPGGVILIVADDVVLAHSLADPLIDSLRSAGFEVEISSGLGSEPSAETLDAVAERARHSGAQAVVGIGGGSVLDSAKLLALLLRNPGSTLDWLGPVTPEHQLAPLLLVPTTCGTGSEATRIAMVTVAGAKRASSCEQFVPSGVIIDPDLVVSLPGNVAAATAMDALSHAVESVFSTSRSPMSLHAAFRAIDLLIPNIEAAAAGDVEARGRCLWGSHLAGQALNAGVVVGHSLAYCIVYEHPLPHATSCALALPYCIAYNRSFDPTLAQSLALAITGGQSERLDAAAEAVIGLARRLNLPTTLNDLQLRDGAEGDMADRCVTEYPRPTNPVPLAHDDLERLLRVMRTGDLSAAFMMQGSAR